MTVSPSLIVSWSWLLKQNDWLRKKKESLNDSTHLIIKLWAKLKEKQKAVGPQK